MGPPTRQAAGPPSGRRSLAGHSVRGSPVVDNVLPGARAPRAARPGLGAEPPGVPSPRCARRVSRSGRPAHRCRPEISSWVLSGPTFTPKAVVRKDKGDRNPSSRTALAGPEEQRALAPLSLVRPTAAPAHEPAPSRRHGGSHAPRSRFAWGDGVALSENARFPTPRLGRRVRDTAPSQKRQI